MGKTGTEREYLVTTDSRNYDSNSPDVGRVKPAENSDGSRQLSTFFGVIVPCVLSMFSVILFLRMGLIVGQAGLGQSLVILFLAYVIIGLTVLSVCAISTNGAIEGGGAYFMISRALGPEFGGAIGLMFFLANVASAALYVFGIVEAMGDYFGPTGNLVQGGLEVGKWLNFGYGSAILFLCLIICLVGANIYAKTTFLIFLVVMASILSVIVSFFAKQPFTIAKNNTVCNFTSINYTGFNKATLDDNVPDEYTFDYTTNKKQDFISVFAIFFNGCIGINAGANMSGELKNPSTAIPKGTIIACFITWFIYLLLMVFISATTPRALLQCDYTFLVTINVWSPFVVIGIFASSLSAVLSQLIGASRILLALAKDELFGVFLRPVTKTTTGGNPFVAVLVTWILVQLVLFAGKVNTIAPVVTIFFLFAYAAVDMACLALEWASAPNFRPTFKLFSWHTCLLGMLSCIVMMFLISPIYASVSTLVLIILVIIIHYRVPTSSWGYISQALIFHQVRKYLLMLDVRKEHVKFWRPQILLMVRNPRTCCQLIDFINSIKKSGLYVLGHVSPGRLADMPRDILQGQYHHWINLVEELGVKAFVELTLSDSIREGTEHLLRIAGLGGMKPNTLVLGFYDDSPPQDSFQPMNIFKATDQATEQRDRAEFEATIGTAGISRETSANYFTTMNSDDATLFGMGNKKLQPEEYVAIIADAIKLRKNVCLGRHFPLLNKTWLRERCQAGEVLYIDVWPFNFLYPVLSRPQSKQSEKEQPLIPKSPNPFDMGTMCGIPDSTSSFFDVTSVFLMQMACILNMTPFWKKSVKLRINLCSELGVAGADVHANEELKEFLNTVRIKAQIRTVPWKDTPFLPSYQKTHGLPIPREASNPDVSDMTPAIQNPPLTVGVTNDDVAMLSGKPQHNSVQSPTIGEDEESVKEYLSSVNTLIKSHVSDSAVTFLYLPSPPSDETKYSDFLGMLTAISEDVGPTLFVHGLSHVVSTTL